MSKVVFVFVFRLLLHQNGFDGGLRSFAIKIKKMNDLIEDLCDLSEKMNY